MDAVVTVDTSDLPALCVELAGLSGAILAYGALLKAGARLDVGELDHTLVADKISDANERRNLVYQRVCYACGRDAADAIMRAQHDCMATEAYRLLDVADGYDET